MKNQERIKNKGVNKGLWLSLIGLGLLMSLGPHSEAQQKFSTMIYLDYTYFLSNDGPLTSPPPDQPAFKNNSFTFRRAYFRYDNKINDNLGFRLTFDADYVKAVDSKGQKDDKLRPLIKHLYLEYKNLFGQSSLKVGIADTITFKLAEERWGYRSVAKEIMDNFKDITGKEIDATSADLGVNLTGGISQELRYGLQLVNGSGYAHPEDDKYKKVLGQIHLIPLSGLSLVAYADYEKQGPKAKALTYKTDLYFERIRKLVIGVENFIYKNDLNKTKLGEKYNCSGVSAFARYTISPNKIAAFVRYDYYEPNSKQDKDEISLVIAGVDWAPVNSNFKLQPNFWFYHYHDPDKKSDLIFNLTLLMTF